MTSLLSHSLVSRTAAQLADAGPTTLYAARDAARELKPQIGATIVELTPVLRAKADGIRATRNHRQLVRAMGWDPVRWSIVDRYQTCEVDADVDLRSALRRVAGCSDRDACPVQVVWGTQPPRERGTGFVKYHWHNCGASGTVYHPSTRRVEVGVGWLSVHMPVLLAGQTA